LSNDGARETAFGLVLGFDWEPECAKEAGLALEATVELDLERECDLGWAERGVDDTVEAR
jgi:hypothetical protein